MESVGIQQAGNTIGNQSSLHAILHSNADTETKNRRVAQEFESVFLHRILMEFDKTVNREDNILYAGKAEDMYRGMMYQEMARSMAKNGGIGISDLMIREMEKE